MIGEAPIPRRENDINPEPPSEEPKPNITPDSELEAPKTNETPELELPEAGLNVGSGDPTIESVGPEKKEISIPGAEELPAGLVESDPAVTQEVAPKPDGGIELSPAELAEGQQITKQGGVEAPKEEMPAPEIDGQEVAEAPSAESPSPEVIGTELRESNYKAERAAIEHHYDELINKTRLLATEIFPDRRGQPIYTRYMKVRDSALDKLLGNKTVPDAKATLLSSEEQLAVALNEKLEKYSQERLKEIMNLELRKGERGGVKAEEATSLGKQELGDAENKIEGI